MEKEISNIVETTKDNAIKISEKAIPAVLQKTLVVILAVLVTLISEKIGSDALSITNFVYTIIFIEVMQLIVGLVLTKKLLENKVAKVNDIWENALNESCEIHNKSWTLNLNDAYSFYQDELEKLREIVGNQKIENKELVLEMNRMVRLLIQMKEENIKHIKKMRLKYE